MAIFLSHRVIVINNHTITRSTIVIKNNEKIVQKKNAFIIKIELRKRVLFPFPFFNKNNETKSVSETKRESRQGLLISGLGFQGCDLILGKQQIG